MLFNPRTSKTKNILEEGRREMPQDSLNREGFVTDEQKRRWHGSIGFRHCLSASNKKGSDANYGRRPPAGSCEVSKFLVRLKRTVALAPLRHTADTPLPSLPFDCAVAPPMMSSEGKQNNTKLQNKCVK